MNALKELSKELGEQYQPPMQRMWVVMRKQAETFNVEDIEKLAHVKKRSARHYITQLVKAGIVSLVTAETVYFHKGNATRHVYKLEKDLGYNAPQISKDGQIVSGQTKNRAMWNTLRITGQAFNAEELAMIASNDETKIAAGSASAYLYFLFKAGYLKKVKVGGKVKYKILPNMNTGSQPPQIQRTRQVFDPNTHMVMFAERPEFDEEMKHGNLGVFHA